MQPTRRAASAIPLRPDVAAAVAAARSHEFAARRRLAPAAPSAHDGDRTAPASLHLCYLLPRTDIGGGTRILVEHANRLTARGHHVTVLSHFDRPTWFDLRCEFRQVPFGLELAEGVPACDVIVAGYWDQILAARALGLAPVVHFEQGDFHLFEDLDADLLADVRTHLEAADHTLTVSSTVAAVLRAKYDVDATVVHNAVDSIVFHPWDGERDSPPYVLCVGWDGNGFKGMTEMREVAAALRADGRDLDVVWVTPRPPRQPFGRVVVAPGQAKLARLYRDAAAYVCCSHYESFPLPPLEAMACGTPVVSTKNVGVMEYARDGQNALLADVRDVAGLTAHVRRVLDDPALAAELRANGLRTPARFTWEAIAGELEEVYGHAAKTWADPAPAEDWCFRLRGARFRDPDAEERLRRRAAVANTRRIALPVSFPAFEGHRVVRWQTVGERDGGEPGVTRVFVPADADEPPSDLPYRDALRDFGAGRFDAALTRFLDAYHAGGDVARASIARWLVFTLVELGRDAEAADIAAGGVEKYADYADYHYLRALTAALTGDRIDGNAYVNALGLLGPSSRYDEWFDDVAKLARDRLVADEEDGVPTAHAIDVLVCHTEPSRLHSLHQNYFVQQVRVSDELTDVPRVDVFRKLLADQRVLHVGYADWPITDPAQNLHVQLDAVCAQLDGIDPNDEAAAVLGPLVRGRLFRDWSQVTDAYDVVLVPEVLEHVGDVASFFRQLDDVEFATILITVPDAFQCHRRHFEYDAATSVFTKVVHPDHNYWFTPYTFFNVVTKHTRWRVEGLWFFNRISLLMAASKRGHRSGQVC